MIRFSYMSGTTATQEEMTVTMDGSIIGEEYATIEGVYTEDDSFIPLADLPDALRNDTLPEGKLYLGLEDDEIGSPIVAITFLEKDDSL